MRLAIADPPYLGRAALWYGGRGRSKRGPSGRACGRGNLVAEYHPDASRWDDPAAHIALMSQMDADHDGWAMAASGKTRRAVGTGHRVTDMFPGSGAVGRAASVLF